MTHAAGFVARMAKLKSTFVVFFTLKTQVELLPPRCLLFSLFCLLVQFGVVLKQLIYYCVVLLVLDCCYAVLILGSWFTLLLLGC